MVVMSRPWLALVFSSTWLKYSLSFLRLVAQIFVSTWLKYSLTFTTSIGSAVSTPVASCMSMACQGFVILFFHCNAIFAELRVAHYRGGGLVTAAHYRGGGLVTVAHYRGGGVLPIRRCDRRHLAHVHAGFRSRTLYDILHVDLLVAYLRHSLQEGFDLSSIVIMETVEDNGHHRNDKRRGI